MLIELSRRDGYQPARARQAARLLMNPAVIALTIIRLEDKLQMIGNLLVRELSEPAQALHCTHNITFLVRFPVA
jgi:hypothetical protein